MSTPANTLQVSRKLPTPINSSQDAETFSTQVQQNFQICTIGHIYLIYIC